MRDLKGYIQYAKERSRETKEKILSRLLRKEVEIGANGTQNYIIKKGVDPKKILEKLLKIYDERGAEYPAEHNVGHEYNAKTNLLKFYKKLDPTNSFNPGIGKSSKKINWK